MNKIMCLILLVFLATNLVAQEEQDMFVAGNEAYEAENFSEAIESYKRVHEANLSSPELYLNMGNAYFQTKDFAHAILSYERGLKLSPNHGGILQNLDLANDQLAAEISEVPPFLLIRWWRSFCNIFSTNVWAILQIISLLAISYILGSRFMGKGSLTRTKSLASLVALVPLFLLITLALMSRYNFSVKDQSAVVMEEIILKEGPDERSGQLNELYPGNKVNILDQINDWYKVSLANQMIGWIPSGSVEKI